jgi:hypothetical protein
MEREISWPPSKEELQRLYSKYKSIRKIAKIFGKSPAAVRMRMMIYGIPRNTHGRRKTVTVKEGGWPPTKEELEKAYASYKSIRKLAKIYAKNPSSVRYFLIKYGIPRYHGEPKKTFDGNKKEMLYLCGYSEDLYVTRDKKCIVAMLSTTHPASVLLFKTLFQRYSKVGEQPRINKGLGCNGHPAIRLWTRLHSTFDFLIKYKKGRIRFLKETVKSREEALSHLSGLIDSEGCITIRKDRKKKINGEFRYYYTPIIYIGNSNKELLMWVKEWFGGYVYQKTANYYMYEICGPKCLELLRNLQLRHEEKVYRRMIMLKYPLNEAYAKIKEHREIIKKQVDEYLRKLRESIELRNTTNPSSHTNLKSFLLACWKLNRKHSFRPRGKTLDSFIEKYMSSMVNCLKIRTKIVAPIEIHPLKLYSGVMIWKLSYY